MRKLVQESEKVIEGTRLSERKRIKLCERVSDGERECM